MDTSEVTDRIVRHLSLRAGFDSWWEDIDRSIQDDIKDSIRQILEEGLSQDASTQEAPPVG